MSLRSHGCGGDDDGDGDCDGDGNDDDDDEDEDGDDNIQQLSVRQGTNSTAMMIKAGVNDDYEAVRCSS